MAHYDGPVSVDASSFDAFVTATNGNSYDFDYISGCQCVDLAKLLNYQLGYPSPYWSTGGTGRAYGGWTDTSARAFNAGTQYTLIYDVTQVKRGDMIVFNHFTGNIYGHVGFAYDDYNNPNNIRVLSQNNGGSPAPGGGTTVNIANYSLSYFLGAFRLNAWQNPQPLTHFRKKKFPWVLYARKLRKR